VVKNGFAFVFPIKAELMRERDYYLELSSSLAQNIQQTSTLEARVEELSKLLELSSSISYKSVAANILANSPGDDKQFFIDRGSEDGIRNGLAVVIEEASIIGVVTQTQPERSLITLLQHENSSIPAKISSDISTSGLIEGSGGFLLNMNYVPQTEKLFIADVVVTSGLGSDIPQGLIIGTISEIITEATSPFQQARITPLFDGTMYSAVLVLDPLGL